MPRGPALPDDARTGAAAPEGKPGEGPEEPLLEGMVPGYPDAAVAIERRSRRTLLRRLLAGAVLALALATLGTEVVLRASRYRHRVLASTTERAAPGWVALMQAGVLEAVADPVRRYALLPGADTTVDGATFRVSAAGARGPELASPKPTRERRILAVGGSYCFGLWCDEDETLVARLAALATRAEVARGSGLVWRGVDLGVPGYHVGQDLRALEQDGLALAPDAVVVYTSTDDIRRSGSYYEPAWGLQVDCLPLPVWLKRPLRHSYLYDAIARWHFRQYASLPSPELDPRVPWAPVREDNQEATRSALARIVSLCRERGVPVFLVNQPRLTWMGTLRDPHWPFAPLVAWAESVRADLGVPGLDLLGWARGWADGVDRMAGLAPDAAPPPPDFLLDRYFADPRVQAALARAQEDAHERGLVWDDLPVERQASLLEDGPAPPPERVDFHLTGAGYEHVARLTYAAMRKAGILP